MLAPGQERLPPQTLRVTTAGPMAQEGEQRRRFGGEMGGEALHSGEWPRMGYAPGEVGCQCFKGAGDTGCRGGA